MEARCSLQQSGKKREKNCQCEVECNSFRREVKLDNLAKYIQVAKFGEIKSRVAYRNQPESLLRSTSQLTSTN